MTDRDTITDRRTLFVGGALILAGLVLGLRELDLLPGDAISTWWALLIAGFGAYRVVTQEGQARRGGALLMLFAGWLLLNILHVGGLGFRNSWPLVPLLLGLFGIVWPAPDGDRFGSLVLAGIGLWTLLGTRGVVGLDLATSWPLLLLFIGLAIVLRALLQAMPNLQGRRKS
jgi:hypothetical protein